MNKRKSSPRDRVVTPLYVATGSKTIRTSLNIGGDTRIGRYSLRLSAWSDHFERCVQDRAGMHTESAGHRRAEAVEPSSSESNATASRNTTSTGDQEI